MTKTSLSRDLPTTTLLPFVAITFAITWGTVGFYIGYPDMAVAWFGEISGSHPFFFLATWGPAIAAFLLVPVYTGWAGLIIGAMWGLWHLPAFYLSGTVQSGWSFTPFFIGNVVLAVLVTPLFNQARGSLMWPMLFHWQLINPFWPDAQPYDPKVQRKLDSFQVRYGFPGATLAYVLPDGSRGTVASGLADVEAATPMTPQTRMLAASIGKSFVAATVLALVSEGRLKRADLPQRTMDQAGRLVWDPAMEWTGGGLVSTASDLAAWGDALFRGQAMPAPYLARLLDAVQVAPDAPQTLYGAGVAIYARTPHGRVFGHGGWIHGYVSSLRHYADHGVTIAFQINTDVGMADNSTDLVPALEAGLADLIIAGARR